MGACDRVVRSDYVRRKVLVGNGNAIRDKAQRRTKRIKKVRCSADGTPYTIWQERTRLMCFALIAWALVEIAVGVGFITLSNLGMIDLSQVFPNTRFGPTTLISGVFNLVVAGFGLYGAYNPQRITLFFWAVFLNAMMSSWQVASAWSSGEFDPATTASLAIALAFAVCAWNVRGQTGYFDNHPKPDDPDELPLERGRELLDDAKTEGAERREAARIALEEHRERALRDHAAVSSKVHDDAIALERKIREDAHDDIR